MRRRAPGRSGRRSVPYHYLGRDLGAPSVFAKAMDGSGIDVRILDWYVGVPIPR
jgi:hypothetical protein